MSTLWDYFDLFPTYYSFSNKISSKFGKTFTIGFIVVFLYFIFSSLIQIYSNNEISVISIETYNNTFNALKEEYFKLIHVQIDFRIYTINGRALEEAETNEMFTKYFNAQVYSMNRLTSSVHRGNLIALQCGQNGNILKFCLSYNFTFLDDILFVTFQKPPLLNQKEYINLFNNYQISLRVQHYFTLSCHQLALSSKSKIDEYLVKTNQQFFSNNLLDYVRKSRGSLEFKLTDNLSSEGNNINLNMKVLRLKLDSGLLLSNIARFNSYMFSHVSYSYSPNILSLSFKIMPQIQTFNFKYKKVQECFAEIGGIMTLVKFCGNTIILFINFFKQHSYFSSTMLQRKIIFLQKCNPSEIEMLKHGRKVEINMPIIGTTLKNNYIDQHSAIANTNSNLNVKGEQKKISLFTSQNSHQLGNTPQFIEQLKDPIILRADQISGVFKLTHTFKLIPQSFSLSSLSIKTKETGTKSGKMAPVFNQWAMFLIIAFGCCAKSWRIRRRIAIDMILYNIKRMDFFQIIQTARQIEIIIHLLLSDQQQAMLKFIDEDQLFYDLDQNKTIIANKYRHKYDKKIREEICAQYANNIKSKKIMSDIDIKLAELCVDKITI